MLQNNGLGFGLSTAPLMSKGVTRSITAENPQGEKGQGGKEASNLGIGRKGRPCITLPQGQTVTLAEIQGTGVLQHFWITVTDKTEKGFFVLRDLVLRMYWDDEQEPSVEVPLGDFFCNGFGARCNVNSLPIAVNPTGGMNCYFPMPFRRAAKITIENQHAAEVRGFFYQFSYTLVDELPEEAAYFHAQWRRENLTVEAEDFTIVDQIKGRGHYVGTYLAWAALERYWWGEGEVKFYIDGDEEWPTICGTGTEDYFGGAWCFYEKVNGLPVETPYSTPYLGYPYYSKTDTTNAQKFGEDAVPMHGMYRWHLMDPIRFEEDLKVTIQQIGHNGLGLFERTDDVSSVAYWYQAEPHAPFPVLPPAPKRWPR
jgi:hypothetical protein